MWCDSDLFHCAIFVRMNFKFRTYVCDTNNGDIINKSNVIGLNTYWEKKYYSESIILTILDTHRVIASSLLPLSVQLTVCSSPFFFLTQTNIEPIKQRREEKKKTHKHVIQWSAAHFFLLRLQTKSIVRQKNISHIRIAKCK